MSFSMAHLLMVDEHVPEGAREALRAAQSGPRESREALRAAAARILARQTDLECHEIRELVDMPGARCG